MSHSREEDTYPRLAVPLGWVSPAHLIDVIEAVVTVQRDWGRRDDRQRARLKYTIEERGIETIRAEVGRRAGVDIAPLAEQVPWSPEDYHGTRDGVVGLPVPSGKVADRDGVDLRTALRSLVADGTRHGDHRHRSARTSSSTASADGRTDLVEDRLRSHGVKLAGDVSALRRLAIACPALPTCGQALGEAERVLPGPRHRVGEGARRLRQRRRPDPAQHDGLPERLRPPLQQRDRHRRADEEGLRHLRRRRGGR